MRDFRKMVTAHNISSIGEEFKLEHELESGDLVPKLHSGTNANLQINRPLRSSFNEPIAPKQKIHDKQINFGFNSFIGSGNTPQDLKVQTAKKARLAAATTGSQAAGKQSFVVSEKHLFSNNPQQAAAANPMRDRLMTEFLKKKITPERFEQVEKVLQNEANPAALLKKPS